MHNLTIYILNRLRILFKSLGKKEESFNDLINYLSWKNHPNLKNFEIKKKEIFNDKKIKLPKYLIVTITFYYDQKKIKYLRSICKELFNISSKCKVVIVTNLKSHSLKKKLIQKIKFKNLQVETFTPENLTSSRFLPWTHLIIMQKYFKIKKYSHFLNLEDDILISKKNFIYWIKSRILLKKFNLIPGFIRTENKNNKLYAIDFVKKNKKTKLAYISVNNNYHFISHKFPYQGMYLYDRELMKEHLNGPSSNPDCGHGAFDLKYLDKRMINLDLMAKANIGLTYINVPKGFNSRLVIPYDLNIKKLSQICFIKHLSNKYSKFENSWFGNYKVDEVID
tara:strand:+ start:371 stop:1381 length:1011 start_codon:yes stop_codon:yes gene_type:complete